MSRCCYISGLLNFFWTEELNKSNNISHEKGLLFSEEVGGGSLHFRFGYSIRCFYCKAYNLLTFNQQRSTLNQSIKEPYEKFIIRL